MATVHVQGHCPACGWESLILADDNWLVCSRIDCTEPTAVADILQDRETEHVVTFAGDGWTIRHPLRERLRDQLERCPLHNYCTELAGPPVQQGRYRARFLMHAPNGLPVWGWERLEPLEGL